MRLSDKKPARAYHHRKEAEGEIDGNNAAYLPKLLRRLSPPATMSGAYSMHQQREALAELIVDGVAQRQYLTMSGNGPTAPLSGASSNPGSQRLGQQSRRPLNLQLRSMVQSF